MSCRRPRSVTQRSRSHLKVKVTQTIEDSLLGMNLSLNYCRDQCYDGATNMSGSKKGVAKQITDKEPRAFYIHCYGHALNLAIGDTLRQSKVMRDALDTKDFKANEVLSKA